MKASNSPEENGAGPRRVAAIVLICALALLGLACGGAGQAGGAQGGGGSGEEAASEPGGGASGGAKSSGAGDGTNAGNAGGEATGAEKTGASGQASGGTGKTGEEAELARAKVSPKEIATMLPADGKRPDEARPLPENPPQGIEVYPATTNRTTEKPISYDREPPTNGDHDTSWQNCGFYEKPLNDRHVVHSMDHGVVWITYKPNLPAEQVRELRSYGREDYVVVSPYPGQDVPVIATSWRVQLELDGANDPRLRKFVDEFRISEIAPLSGNRCVGGVGNPPVKPAA